MDENISIDERLDCYIIILIFQMLGREEKIVKLQLENIHEIIDNIESGEYDDYDHQNHNLEKRKVTLELWQYWWEVFTRSNTKENIQYRGLYLNMNSNYTDKWKQFSSVKGEFNKFMVLLAIKLWEIVDYDVYLNIYDDLTDNLDIHPLE